MKIQVTYLAALLLFSIPAMADEFRCYPEQPGTWQIRADISGVERYGLKPSQGREFVSQLKTAAGRLGSASLFNPPHGFRVGGVVDLCAPPGCSFKCGTPTQAKKDRYFRDCASQPAMGRIWLILYAYASGPDGKPLAKDPEIGTQIELTFNDPDAIFNAKAEVTLPDGREVAPEPKPWDRIKGVQIYQQEREEFYIFLTTGRLLWVPVTREQYLTALIHKREAESVKQQREIDSAEAELAKEEREELPTTASSEIRAAIEKGRAQARASFAEQRAGIAQGLAELTDPLREELRSMSAKERASQAWIGNDTIDPLVPAFAAGGRKLVAFNPDYFDRSRPHTEIQLVTIPLHGLAQRGQTPSDWGCLSGLVTGWTWGLATQVDWQNLVPGLR